MNSTISDDLSRKHLAIEATKCLENIGTNNARNDLRDFDWTWPTALKALIELLNCYLINKMSSTTPNNSKCNSQTKFSKSLHETNNNSSNKASERQQARNFITWYKRMIDEDRHNLTLYISDDAVLEWFGRTIKTRKKVTAFLKYDMQSSRHDFITIESIDKIQSRNEKCPRNDDTLLASPLHSPEIISSKNRSRKRRLLRSNCNSPEWAEGCQPQEEISIDKKQKTDNNEHKREVNTLKRSYSDEEISNRGDCLNPKVKKKCALRTPPNCEVGQGDCLPSTSGTDSDKSHDALNAQLPKLAVECNGYIEFTRSRNSRSIDSMKWDRKCKVQISYSEDPLNVGEYIIWSLRYTDDNKCRRNLLAAFEEVAKEEELKQVTE
ncbi:unnamed protein product [Arctia plantaginis]|uniref:Uncharacterized protein n=1 Tax=Arctia plantaginis TaxID=874455 RepID=A0A8S0ZYR9_ARCPL|nr:unnamed protein product [Arctia plantaginis]